MATILEHLKRQLNEAGNDKFDVEFYDEKGDRYLDELMAGIAYALLDYNMPEDGRLLKMAEREMRRLIVDEDGKISADMRLKDGAFGNTGSISVTVRVGKVDIVMADHDSDKVWKYRYDSIHGKLEFAGTKSGLKI